MPHTFNTLASDFRLYDLFGDAGNLSATQLWILEIERDGASELRFLYGRTVPSTYQSNTWAGTTTKKTPLYEKCSVRTHALTLHTSAEKLKEFLQSFINGASFQDASRLANLVLEGKLGENVGSVAFGAKPNVRPVMHLPTRDYFQLHTYRLSPTSFASVNSGAVFSEGKPNVFSIPEESDRKIAEAACYALDADTGLNFASLDAWRLGDFEFICAPGLTKSERQKFAINLKGKNSSLKLFEQLTREPADLLLVLKAYSDDSVQASYVVRLDKSTPYPLDHTFTVEEFKNQVATAYTLELYALGEADEESYLLLQTGAYFVRSMNLNMQVMASIGSSEEMSWLKKQVPAREKVKLEATGRVARAIRPSRSEIGGHTDDRWVSQNRLIESNVHGLLPKASTGRFFPTLSDSGGTSRLHLVDWLREIFERHHDAQIAWIDPFMEDVGIDLLHRMGTSTGSYLIITTEKQPKEDSEAETKQPSRIQRLLSRCAGWGNGYFGNVRLKVLTVPESKVHDRMILIRASDGRPIAGFHLSNSIQRANDNFPLLATPIPLDVLPQVFEYADRIIQSTLHGDEKSAPTANLIFDSTAYIPGVKEDPKGLNQRSSFVVPSRAGDILAWWLNEPELAGLSGPDLLSLMQTKGYLKDDQLDANQFKDVPSKLWSEGFPLQNFHSAWDAVGYVLAHSHAGELFTEDQTLLPDALKHSLFEHLDVSRANALPALIKKSYLDIEHYRAKSLRALLLSNDTPSNAFRYSPVETAWSDYYTIKILWPRVPQDFVNWLSAICSTPFSEHPRKRALVIQAFQHICLTLGFDKRPEQIEALLKSKVSIVTWVGIHVFKAAISDGSLGIEALSKLDLIEPNSEQRTVLCWLINEANYDKSDARSHLIAKLTQSINGSLTDKQLQDMLQLMRSPLGRLHHFTPWILESLLIPLLGLQIINAAQVSREWLGDLTTQWREALNGGSLYFKLDGDGAFSDELAALTAHLSPTDQAQIFDELWKIFKSIARTIRQPLSAQVGWTYHIRAHEVNLWLYALARRMASLVHKDNNQSLKELLEESELLIERLPISAWENGTNQELLMYLKGDPDQIKTHRLLHPIQVAINASM